MTALWAGRLKVARVVATGAGAARSHDRIVPSSPVVSSSDVPGTNATGAHLVGVADKHSWGGESRQVPHENLAVVGAGDEPAIGLVNGDRTDLAVPVDNATAHTTT